MGLETSCPATTGSGGTGLGTKGVAGVADTGARAVEEADAAGAGAEVWLALQAWLAQLRMVQLDRHRHHEVHLLILLELMVKRQFASP